MEEIYANVDYNKPVDPTPSTNQTGPRSSERRLHGAVVLCLGLLSVVLLVGLIILGVTYRDLAAEHSTIKANLTERLQASNDKLSSVSEERDLLNANLTSVSKELDTLQSLSKQNRDLAAEHSTIKANLTERLQASNDKLSSVSEERDLLKANLTSVSKELDTLQCLSKQKRTCPAGWKMFSCTCYLFSTKTDSWENGKKDCRDRGAELVIIDTVEKQEFIFKTLKEDNWIGLNDREKEGTWKWIDGTPLTVGYWRTGEPNNNGPGGEEDCVQIKSGVNAKESWNDVHCDNSLPWICAKKPQYLHEF
ncbi:C-type lectin domain family 10 member A-like isoform X1 [Sparus aurata]|uniref:C-type lectin domain family 10 member A-like isoform X1 n=1 Tax=Sparus aurata TaxID=8175 RepID=UPI0011C1B115|nr:C-type lectin domain family 10 member A-like isoform X1 [Sparus aurata]